MRNLTLAFKKIISSDSDWRFLGFQIVLETLKERNIQTLFWEGEENWASIINDNKVVGYIWVKFPLIIYEKNRLPNIQEKLINIKKINYLIVESLTKSKFQFNDEVKYLFESPPPYNSFTIEDLWFYSNSI